MGKYILGCAGLAIVGIIILVIVVIAGWADSYNNLVSLKQGVDSQWAEVENQYERRADLTQNLVNTVAGAANFEKSTLIAVTDARASVGQVKIDRSQAPTDQAQLQQYDQAQGNLSSALSRLLVVSENYPDLKSNQNFLDLQAQLEGTENRIATARNRFNEAARAYNTAVQGFFTSFIATHYGFTTRPYFQARQGSDVAPVVNFDSMTNAAPAH